MCKNNKLKYIRPKLSNKTSKNNFRTDIPYISEIDMAISGLKKLQDKNHVEKINNFLKSMSKEL